MTLLLILCLLPSPKTQQFDRHINSKQSNTESPIPPFHQSIHPVQHLIDPFLSFFFFQSTLRKLITLKLLPEMQQRSLLQQQQECYFCIRPPKEVKLILMATLTRLKLMLRDKRYSELLASGQQEQPSALCSRLVRVLFDKYQLELKWSRNCKHMMLYSYFKEKLKCKHEQIALGIEQLCDRVARRSYELELIASQIKNAENTIFDLQEDTELQSKSRRSNQNSQSEPQVEEKVKIEDGDAILKVEQQEKGVVVVGNGEIGQRNQQIANTMQYQGYSFPYNVVFYGGPIYQ